MSRLRQHFPLFLCLILAAFYLCHLESDSIAGLFGVLWSDEGIYLLSAKTKALFGTPHIIPSDYHCPEMVVPLIHWLSQWVMSPDDTVWGIRALTTCLTLLGQLLLARLALKYDANPRRASWCLLSLLLFPLLFFYARSALTEAIQWTIIAGILTVLFELYHAKTLRNARYYSAAIGALVALLLLSKITSVAACIGVGIGFLVCVVEHPTLRHPWRLVGAGVVGGILGLGLFSYGFFGTDYALWIQENVNAGAVSDNVPQDLQTALDRLQFHFVGLHHFISMIPMLSFGFVGLLIAADRQRGFLFILWATTFATLIAEIPFGGEIRRNFFGLSLLMFLGSFTLVDYFSTGFKPLRTRTWPRILSWVFVSLFALGNLYFIKQGVDAMDVIYIILAVSFAILLVLALVLRGEQFAGLRKLLYALGALYALAPILFQSFLSPYTIRDGIAAMEHVVPQNSTMTGALLPWFFQGMKRKMIYTNCRPSIAAANEHSALPEGELYYFLTFGSLVHESACNPDDFYRYKPVLEFEIFYPFNKGPGYGGSKFWRFKNSFVLFEETLEDQSDYHREPS